MPPPATKATAAGPKNPPPGGPGGAAPRAARGGGGPGRGGPRGGGRERPPPGAAEEVASPAPVVPSGVVLWDMSLYFVILAEIADSGSWTASRASVSFFLSAAVRSGYVVQPPSAFGSR